MLGPNAKLRSGRVPEEIRVLEGPSRRPPDPAGAVTASCYSRTFPRRTPPCDRNSSSSSVRVEENLNLKRSHAVETWRFHADIPHTHRHTQICFSVFIGWNDEEEDLSGLQLALMLD